MGPLWPLSRPPAFTLVELLVVIAILAVLAGLAVPAFSSSSRSASLAKSVSNLKGFGTAMHSFAADNSGSLPGATGTNRGTLMGVSPIAKSSAANSLQVQLMNYLEKERPRGDNWGVFFMKSLAYPEWQKFNKGTNDNQIPAYLACQSYRLPDGSSISPFGGPAPMQRPMRSVALSAVLSGIPPDQPKPYALIEVDQQLLSALGLNPGWRRNLPTNAHHGRVRNVLYFDGSVAAVPTNQLPKPW
jgi:prepilin-type N-terminal cleavage/methylation domain-containing protein/prepilin-type processing-associated H-X9-DG protein